MYSVREILESRSIAVIGASRDPLKPGSLLLGVLKTVGFKGLVAGVNPQGGESQGMTLYRSLDEVPFPVDLAVIIVSPRAVPGLLLECARKGVKGVVISSEGFAEAGEEGSAYQQEIRAILKSKGMRAFGPNTLGIVNTETGLTTSYFANERMLTPGSVGVAAQSGIFVGALLRYISSFEGLHISKGIGLGNKADVDESDALEFLAQDEQTRIVGMYLEDIRDGRRFVDLARRAVARKPILLLKGGRTSAGALATASHTASLAVDDAVLSGALRQAGVLRMRGIGELLASLMGFLWMPLPKGNRIALVTYSGAQAIMSVDAATEEGLEIALFSPATKQRLARVIATESKAQNPVDIFPDMMVHGFEKISTEILSALLDDEGVHAVVFISFAMFGAELYEPAVRMIEKRRNKPVFFSLLGEKDGVEQCRALLEKHRIPFCLFPEMSVQVISHMWHYARRVGVAS